MRFLISAIGLIGYAISVSADLSILQTTVREQTFAHNDLEAAFRKLEYRGQYDVVASVDEVIGRHRQVVDAVRRGSSNIRAGPSISFLESPQIIPVAELVIKPLQRNMNLFILYKEEFERSGRAQDVYRSLLDSSDAHKDFADALATKLTMLDGAVVQWGSTKFGVYIENTLTMYAPRN
jgi:hypothetical protein